jgi:lipopolysaccharide export system protein LptA
MSTRAWLACCLVGLTVAACAPRVFTPFPERTPAAVKSAAPETKNVVPARPAEDLPAQITSDRLVYTNQGRVSVFQGNVTVRQGATRVEAPYLEVRSEDGQAFAREGVRLIDSEQGVTLTARELEYRRSLANAKARGDVRLVSHDNRGESVRLRSDRLAWDTAHKEALAEGGVRVTSQGSTATAEGLHYRQSDQIIELNAAGNSLAARPQIVQDGNTITGQVITLRLNERVYEVSGTAHADLMPRSVPPGGTPSR